MQYMGSKNRYSKYIVPIIQNYINENTKGYIEPFVGGANIIDKIDCKLKIGCDINEYLIALLKHIQDDTSDIPDFIYKEDYEEVKNNQNNYPIWYQGLIGFCSFGNKMWGGYARNSSQDTTGERTKSYFKGIKSQAPKLKNVMFINKDFQSIPTEKLNNYVIYCDPPYKGTTKYKTDPFPYDGYYDWCREMSKDNIVLCSEYQMPEDFECIWEKETTTQINSKREANNDKNIRIEKLFRIGGSK